MEEVNKREIARADELICYCFHITRGELAELIEKLNLQTVEEVRENSSACHGCQTCYSDIVAFLGELKRKKSPH